MPTLATHDVIWPTYLIWPPGDPRGHWSPLFDLYGHLIRDGCQLNLPDAATKTYAKSIAKEPEKILTPQEIEVVASVIGEMAGPDLPVYAQAIERTHIHLLLGPMADDLAKVVGRIKGRSSSRVLMLPENAGRRRTSGRGIGRCGCLTCGRWGRCRGILRRAMCGRGWLLRRILG
jgi:hypothetical protein